MSDTSLVHECPECGAATTVRYLISVNDWRCKTCYERYPFNWLGEPKTVLHCTASGKLVFRDKVPQGPFPRDYVKT